jgi:uncharacterized membrane protein
MAALLKDPALIVGLIRAALILLVSFGVYVSQDQQDALLAFVGAFLAILSLVLTGVTVSKTTSNTSPTLKQGTVVEVVTPEGQPNKVTVV